MSRDIKFRVWHYGTKKMEYPPTDEVLDPIVIGLNGTVYQVEGEDLVHDTAKTLRYFTYRGQQLFKRHEGEWSEELALGIELMQYTGLKDKNGKEIYEGDILKMDRNLAEVAGAINESKPSNEAKPIEYIQVEWADYGGFHAGPFNVASAAEEGTIIGNIYENPELLNTGK